MRYLGGKQRLGKTFAGFIEALAELDGLSTYCEPFAGMVGVGRRVGLPTRIIRDVNPNVVALLRAVRDGWDPPRSLTEDEYRALRDAPVSAARGFAGFACSFGGKWFGGYARDAKGKNFAAAQRRVGLKLGADLKGADIDCGPYWEAPPAGITYCDPPYASATAYGGTGKFDHDRFWDWVRSREGIVLVSEYSAPDWARAVWAKPVKSTIKRDAAAGCESNARVERLFIIS